MEELKRHKKRKMDVNISTLAGEDHNSLTAHEEWLVAETFKAVPDEKVIEERMNLTATTRLADVASMSVEHMKRKYPYLMDFERFVADFKRLTGVEIKEKLRLGLDLVISLAKKKHIKCEDQVLQIIADATQLQEEGRTLRTRHLLAVAALRIIALNLKEQTAVPALFVHEDDERVPLTPCVKYSGHNLEQADFLHLCVDKEQLFTVKNAEEGIIAVMSSFFVLNIVYGPKSFNTSTVLERLFLGLNVTTPRVVVTKFVNRVVQAMRR
ncbi:uncharacterized protein LOC119435363 [Dermacentor silvarum]|uniref:uncharacterized protein LOC119435363 n=1 Tax=Dermacentor silvarum TaxID=543639 RepID=UPI00189B12C8|nr:uncharacterized protein LOC119435363 [Dermacentor silvarum]